MLAFAFSSPLGLLLIALAIVWWITFYRKAGGIGEAWKCLVYSTGLCRDTFNNAKSAASFAYHPFLLWIGLALWLAGAQPAPPRIGTPCAVCSRTSTALGHLDYGGESACSFCLRTRQRKPAALCGRSSKWTPKAF
jgi:hypothetical protein